MAQYRRRSPVLVEAEPYAGDAALELATAAAIVTVQPGDFIVTDEAGNQVVFSPAEFEATFIAADTPDPKPGGRRAGGEA